MLTEDYCDFETAKLLKEKGFDEICYLGYNKNGEYVPTSNRTNSQIIQPDFCFICCPTLQMAMKWLREVHNIFIEINIIPHTTVTMEQEYYFFKSYKDRRPHNFPLNFSVKSYSSYEEACEDAIKYCLENLI